MFQICRTEFNTTLFLKKNVLIYLYFTDTLWARVELGLDTSSPQLLSTVSEWAERNQSVVKANRRPASQQAHSRPGLYNSSQLSDVVTFSFRTPLGPANEVVSLIACLKIHTGRALVFRDHCEGSFCKRGICVSPLCLLNDRWVSVRAASHVRKD